MTGFTDALRLLGLTAKGEFLFYLPIAHLHILFIKMEKVHYLTVQQMIEQKHLSRNQ